MSARAEAAIPKAKNGSINADELNKPRKLTTFGVSKRPRPKSIFPDNSNNSGNSNDGGGNSNSNREMESPGPTRRIKMSLGSGEDTMPLVREDETQPAVLIPLADQEEDVSLSAAIEEMVRRVEQQKKDGIVRPDNSECPPTFSLQEELNQQEAIRMGSYSKEAEEDANDKEVAVESYYAEECFPVRSVMGFVTRNWRVPLKECELAFVVNKHWWRNTRFDTIDKLETFIRKNRPSRIEIGGIKRNTERFLLFDTDLEDAPVTHAFIPSSSSSSGAGTASSSGGGGGGASVPTARLGAGAQLQGYIRNCACKGTRGICPDGCWFYMVAAVKCLTYIVKNVFGAKHVFPVYSGRRGVHTWVLDEKFVTKTSEEREAIVNRIHALSKPHEYKHPEYTPYLLEYILAPMFDAHILSEKQKGRGCLLACQETIELVSRIVAEMRQLSTGFHNSAEQRTIADAANKAAFDPLGAWNDLVSAFGPVFRERVIFAMLFPRIDANVTTQMNHCIKAPFVIHPDTKRCSVPIPNIDDWNPARAPRLSHFVKPPSQMNNNPYGYRDRNQDEDGEESYSRARLELYIAHMSRMIESAYPFVDTGIHCQP